MMFCLVGMFFSSPFFLTKTIIIIHVFNPHKERESGAILNAMVCVVCWVSLAHDIIPSKGNNNKTICCLFTHSLSLSLLVSPALGFCSVAAVKTRHFLTLLEMLGKQQQPMKKDIIAKNVRIAW